MIVIAMAESNPVPEPEEAKATVASTSDSSKSEFAEGTTRVEPQTCSPKSDTGAVADVKEELNNLEINENAKDINILLLGCTGVGKSTFINSFVNYLTYTDFETALKRNLIVLIPSKIRVTDRNGRPHQITMGTEDKNEYIKTGEAQTQDVKTYVFNIADKNANLRLIDTPGMGDPRGIKQDDINCENILSYIGNLQELHAICFLLKPNESRDTVFFKYCINQIFSRLDKTACYNIIFCFTNTRGTDYNPGETIDVLRKNIEEIRSKPPHATIPSDRNIFCFDNECFRYLAAFKENVDLDENLESRNVDSWEKSVKECWKLYHYIAGDEEQPPLKPHNVRSTKAVNETRRVIGRLSKPLADVAQLIQDNIDLLLRHKETLSQDTKSLEEMKNQLYMPVNTLEVFPLQNPTTVCTARQCADVTQVGGKNAWHYRQRCHEPCGLGRVVTKEIIGDPQLINCFAMSNGVCEICGCNFKVHMHVYYLTQQVMKNEVDTNIQMNITSKEQLLANKKIFLKNLETRQEELEKEHKFIIESSAKFAHFLQNNALTPFSDAYKEYIQYLIEREKSLGTYCDAETVRNLESVLAEYVQLKNQFDEALKNARLIGNPDVINAQDIRNCFENLYKLKHNGPKIKELYEVQEREIVKYHKNQEYKHGTKTFFSNFTNFISKKIFGKKENTQGEKRSENSCHYCHGGQPPAASPFWFHYPQYWQPQPSFQNYGAACLNAEHGNDQHSKTGSRSSQNVRSSPSTTNGRNLSSTSRSYSSSNENHYQPQPNFYRGDNSSFTNPIFPSLPFPYPYPGFPNTPYSGFSNTPYSNYPQAGYDPEVANNCRKEYLNGNLSEENHLTSNHSKKSYNKPPLLPQPNTNLHSHNAQYLNPQQFYFGNHAPPQIPYSPYFYPPQNNSQYPEFSAAAVGTKTTGRKPLVNKFEESDEKDCRPEPVESKVKSGSPVSLGKDKERYNTKLSGAWGNNDKQDSNFEWDEYENKKLTKSQRRTEKRKLKKEQKR